MIICLDVLVNKNKLYCHVILAVVLFKYKLSVTIAL